MRPRATTNLIEPADARRRSPAAAGDWRKKPTLGRPIDAARRPPPARVAGRLGRQHRNPRNELLVRWAVIRNRPDQDESRVRNLMELRVDAIVASCGYRPDRDLIASCKFMNAMPAKARCGWQHNSQGGEFRLSPACRRAAGFVDPRAQLVCIRSQELRTRRFLIACGLDQIRDLFIIGEPRRFRLHTLTRFSLMNDGAGAAAHPRIANNPRIVKEFWRIRQSPVMTPQNLMNFAGIRRRANVQPAVCSHCCRIDGLPPNLSFCDVVKPTSRRKPKGTHSSPALTTPSTEGPTGWPKPAS